MEEQYYSEEPEYYEEGNDQGFDEGVYDDEQGYENVQR